VRALESPQPSLEVLETLGISLLAPLGGRANQHWLVAARGERLVLRRWDKPNDDIAYELRLLAGIAAIGWPAAPAITDPLVIAGQTWTLFPYLPGEPPSIADPQTEQRTRGRLLAEFHADLATLPDLGQRDGWRRCEATLNDPTLDRLLADNERERTEEVRMLRWHLERARARIDGLRPQDRPGIHIHGDFAPWNLRFQNGQLSGILDFDAARWDHRLGDFTLSWRGKHDTIVHAYNEVSPLDPEEWELLTPLWWAYLIEQACQFLAAGTHDDGWLATHLLRRSPLMGPDAEEYR
jgi:Ser/Thr protein kinase RdoA (MazF antagonist)